MSKKNKKKVEKILKKKLCVCANKFFFHFLFCFCFLSFFCLSSSLCYSFLQRKLLKYFFSLWLRLPFALLCFCNLFLDRYFLLLSLIIRDYPHLPPLLPLSLPSIASLLCARKLIRKSSNRGKRGRGREIEISSSTSSSCCCCCSCSLSLQQLLLQQ